jgi:glycosyltransferase involved in cell wall biosynthesis
MSVHEPRSQVLVALHDELMNGATISVLRAVPFLEERGWEFVFWAPQPGPAADWLRERGHRVLGEWRPIVSGLAHLRHPPGPWRRLSSTPGYLRRFASAVRDLDPALVHANSLFSYAEALTARALRVPTFLHLHDMAPQSRKLSAVQWLARRGVDVTAAASSACARSYAHAGWAPEIVYEAAPIPDEPTEIRHAPRPFVVGSVGVISKRKGSDLFVEAAQRLGSAGEGFEFRLVGQPTDPLEESWGRELLQTAAEAGIRHIPHTDVLRELRSWDAFVLPSRMDPFPIVMLEAMATGLPVIGTAVDGLREQITEGSGVLIPPESAGDLAEAIMSLRAMSQEERRALGRAARERVASRFSVEQQAKRLDEIYGSLMGTHLG